MPRRIDRLEPQPNRNLLRDFDAEHDIVAAYTPGAALVNKQPNTVEDFRAVLDQPTGAEKASRLFVCGSKKNDVAVKRNTTAMKIKKGS